MHRHLFLWTTASHHTAIPLGPSPHFIAVDSVCRLTTFQDQWPKLEKWYNKFGTLRKVDASQEPRTVLLEVESILEETLLKVW